MAANSMRDIKRRIKSVNSTEHITSAMKLVSAAKLRKAKAIFEESRTYFHHVTDAIEEVFHSAEEIPTQFLAGHRAVKRTAHIVITSNRGLCGGFNANVIKEATRVIQKETKEGGKEKPFIIAIGTKGKDHFEKRGFQIKGEFIHPPENIAFVDTMQISKPIIEMYNNGEIDEVLISWNTFVNSMSQEPKTVTLLPFERETVSDGPREPVEYEPSVTEVFNYLVPKYVEIMIYGAIVESATCEHAARRIAMESATDNAREMIQSLTLNYNRARQAAITNEISEIVGGSEALK